MNLPVIGYRTWRLDKPRLHGPTREEILLTKMVPLGPLDEWMRARVKVRKPRILPEPILRPLANPKRDTWREPGPIRFHCPMGHDLPMMNCTCGLYAYATLTPAQRELGDVVGVVMCWGHLVLHGLEGFRAEWARIVALGPSARAGMSHAGLAAAKRLGIVWVNDPRQLPTLAVEFGRPLAEVARRG